MQVRIENEFIDVDEICLWPCGVDEIDEVRPDEATSTRDEHVFGYMRGLKGFSHLK